MPSETIQLRGHIIDSLTLPKVLDEITALDGQFEILEFDVGRRPQDPSYVRLRVDAPDEAVLMEILQRIQPHGAEPVAIRDARLEPAPADGVFPDGFYVTTNHPTHVRIGGHWMEVRPVRMDCGIRVDEAAGTARWPPCACGIPAATSATAASRARLAVERARAVRGVREGAVLMGLEDLSVNRRRVCNGRARRALPRSRDPTGSGPPNRNIREAAGSRCRRMGHPLAFLALAAVGFMAGPVGDWSMGGAGARRGRRPGPRHR